MPFDFNELLTPAPFKERKRMAEEEAEARWAEYGRTVHDHMLRSDMIETVIRRVLLRVGYIPHEVPEIAAAIRAYLTTGALP
jgi:hypothetical protein